MITEVIKATRRVRMTMFNTSSTCKSSLKVTKPDVPVSQQRPVREIILDIRRNREELRVLKLELKSNTEYSKNHGKQQKA